MKRTPRWVKIGLIVILLISILLRLIKLFDFALWGSDSGEHYFLIDQLMHSGEIQLNYIGWGFAYPYFHGMHILVSGISLTGNISSFQGLKLVIPIIAAFSVLFIFAISQHIFKDYRVSLISAAFLGVTLPHIYASSHPMPGSLGGFLLLVCIFLILKCYQNKKFILPLIITTIALVLTHHLTTYFLIITIIFIIIFRVILKYQNLEKEYWLNRSKIDIIYLTSLITLSFSYWFIYSESFYDRIVEKNIPIPPIGILLLAYFGIFILWTIIRYRKKVSWRFNPDTYSLKNLVIRLLLFWILGIIVMIVGLITTVPGTNMRSDISAVPYFLPIFTILSFIAVTPAILVFYKNGFTILGWMSAILASLIFSFITNNQELLLYRHFPYFFEPLTIMVSLGFVKFVDMIIQKQDLRIIKHGKNKELIEFENSNTDNRIKLSDQKILTKDTKITMMKNSAATIFIITLLFLCSILSYPPLSVVSGFEEGTTQKELESCFWARENLPEKATIASDHRMSSMLFGISGLNATWDYAPKTFHEGSYEDIVEELKETRIPAGKKRIDYILISSAIENGVALEQWETAEPMSKRAIEKFDMEPFVKLYDNGDCRIYF